MFSKLKIKNKNGELQEIGDFDIKEISSSNMLSPIVDPINKYVVNPIIEKINTTPVVKDVTREMVTAVDNISSTAYNYTVGKNSVAHDVVKKYEANKAGIDGAAGLVARGAAAYYTLGASEMIGGGEQITTQFGRDNDFAQYGKAAGTVGGLYGANSVANGSHALNTAGYVTKGATSAKVADVVSKVSGTGGVGGMAQDGMRTPAGDGGIEVYDGYNNDNFTEGNSMDDFWSELGDQALEYGKEYLNSNVFNNGSAKDRNIPVIQPTYQQPVVQQTATGGIDQKTMMMMGGGLLLVLLLVKR